MTAAQRRTIRRHRQALAALRPVRHKHSIWESSGFFVGEARLVWINGQIGLWDYWWN